VFSSPAGSVRRSAEVSTRGGEGGPWFLLFPILLIVGFVAFGRVVRRTARPIGEVMDAARASPRATTRPGRRCRVRDVRDLARAFNRMAERLQTNEEQRRNLLADVAHELRPPLGDPRSCRGDG
jgi:two-component system sensor histidine kinase BaeS